MTGALTAPPRAGRAQRVAALRWAALTAGLVLALALSLAVGARPTALGHVVAALVDPASLPDSARAEVVVVRELRLPRTAIGLLAGAALGVAGVLVRGVTRNPVADPGLLGVNAGASLGVVLALAGGVSVLPGLVGAAMLGALACAALVALVATTSRGGTALLVIAGAATTAGLTSVTSLLLLSRPDALEQFRFWTVGALTGRGFDQALALAPVVLVAGVAALTLARPLDALALGDDVARGLGFRLRTTRVTTVAVVVLLCGAATALAGPLVFVGLVAAHAARLAVGTRHLLTLPAAAALGATLLLVADTAGRVVAPPGEIEAGLVVTALGAPVLVALVRAGAVR